MPGKPTAQGPAEIPDRVMQFLEDLHNFMSSQAGANPSMADTWRGMKRILNRAPAPPKRIGMSSQAQAEELMDQAEDEDGDLGAELTLDALRVDPKCARAWTYLGYDAGAELEIAGLFFMLALDAAMERLGERTFVEDAGHFWGMFETRPFMRALEGLAGVMAQDGRLETAIAQYEWMLRLNPNDNQGVRTLLLALYLELGDRDGASKLLSQYARDPGAEMAFGRALFEFQQSGASPAAVAALAAARTSNPWVERYLTGAKRLPPHDPRMYTMGHEDEAVIVASNQREAWKRTRGAVEWLRDATGWRPTPRKKRTPPA
jgi:tetratricopeptide (TPR) repeat protein